MVALRKAIVVKAVVGSISIGLKKGRSREMSAFFHSFPRCAFNVEVKNERRGFIPMVTWTRMVDFQMFGHNIRLLKGSRVLVSSDVEFLNQKIPILRICSVSLCRKVKGANRKECRGCATLSISFGVPLVI